MGKFFKYQGYHLGVYIVLGAVLYIYTWQLSDSSQLFWGMSSFEWIVFSWIFAFVHQVWVLFFWRMELYYGKISTWLGQSGFLVFRGGFFIVASVRLVPIIFISYLTSDSSSIPRNLSIALIVLTTPFILWALYSVLFYFGITRLTGADHFDPSYRSKSLELRGIFKYIPNSMYSILLLSLYHPGLLWDSQPGLVVALIHHAMVWTHYFCTEKPDMKVIYNKS